MPVSNLSQLVLAMLGILALLNGVTIYVPRRGVDSADAREKRWSYGLAAVLVVIAAIWYAISR